MVDIVSVARELAKHNDIRSLGGACFGAPRGASLQHRSP